MPLDDVAHPVVGRPDVPAEASSKQEPSRPLDLALEEQRIRDAYARRQKGDPRYAWSSLGHVFNMQERERHVLRLLTRAGMMPLAGKAILEVGCGSGCWLRDFVKWGALPDDVYGIDLLPDRVVEARRSVPPAVRVACHNAAVLPFAAETFDLVLQATMFSSVIHAGTKERIAVEMLRVLKPGGLIMWYDFCLKNPHNPDVRAVRRAEIRALFPRCRIDLRHTTLARPLS